MFIKTATKGLIKENVILVAKAKSVAFDNLSLVNENFEISAKTQIVSLESFWICKILEGVCPSWEKG